MKSIIRVNRLSNSVICYEVAEPKQLKSKNESGRLIDYPKDGEGNRIYSISRKQATRIKVIGKFFRLNSDSLKFWTITTCQSKAQQDDRVYGSVMSKFIENVIKQGIISKFYLWVAERQKNGSIHYHLIVEQLKNFDLEIILKYLNDRLPSTGTNVFNFTDIGVQGREAYITKERKISNIIKMHLNKEEYIIKGRGKQVAFLSRPSQISHSLIKLYEDNKHLYEDSIDVSKISHEQCQKIMSIIDKCEVVKINDYVFYYKGLTQKQVDSLYIYINEINFLQMLGLYVDYTD